MPCQAGAGHFHQKDQRSKCPIDEQVRCPPRSAINKAHCRTNPNTRPVQPSLHLIQRSREAHRPSDVLRASPRTHSHFAHSRPARPPPPQHQNPTPRLGLRRLVILPLVDRRPGGRRTMAEEAEVEMETSAGAVPVPFQLQLDKSIPFQVGLSIETLALFPLLVGSLLTCDAALMAQINIAEWNPEKDLLAMVTEDSKVVLHRFNWQRLWMISPGEPYSALHLIR
ncbi:hypothetical protein GW17_00025444 [Ensete ventricosum]|uniref:Uncharacterized protein n=1 Tax=Ensete ventricosum TaxID=4639 RepID=A0A427AET5_ENSVE|nr:hypothetical protein B296_00008553 [Ensete ventricosum]RWW10980.1 hypothetical protein GW17_00025444 [Ensete ventricosum]RZS09464.1 hypothetical protein BHM03_00040544 [Ensete ventricosum]